jgi:hypothetical protein
MGKAAQITLPILMPLSFPGRSAPTANSPIRSCRPTRAAGRPADVMHQLNHAVVRVRRPSGDGSRRNVANVRGRIYGQRQQPPLRVRQCQLFSSLWLQRLQSDQLLHLLEIDGRHQRDPHPVIGALPARRPMHQLRIRALDFDVRHRVVASLIYYLPIGQGRMWAPSSKIVDAVIGGWEYATLIQLQTGTPGNPGVNANTADTNTISGGTPATRPNLVSKQFYEPHRTVGSTGQYANPAAFQEPAPGFLGNVSRNMLYGPVDGGVFN